jgi:hypothetical protein
MVHVAAEEYGNKFTKLKGLFLGYHNYELIASEEDVSMIPSSSLEKMSLEKLGKFKIIMIAGKHEYLSYRQVKKLIDYVSSGGTVILRATEFAFRFIGINKDSDSFEFESRTKLKKAQSIDKHMGTGAAILNLEDFFGVSLEYGIGLFDYKLNYEVVDNMDPLIKGLNLSIGTTIATNESWFPAAKLIKSKNGRYCFDNKLISCADTRIIAVAKHKASPDDIRCCEWQKEEDFSFDSKVNNTESVVPEIVYGVVGMFKRQKGRVVILPPDFVDPEVERHLLRQLLAE